MHRIAVMLFSMIASTVWAQGSASVDYQKLINQAWPQHELRADQIRWLAQASSQAHANCQHAGYASSHCDEVVLLALQEQLGETPHQAAISAVRWSLK